MEFNLFFALITQPISRQDLTETEKSMPSP